MAALLRCTMIGLISRGVQTVSKITPSVELFQIDSVRRIQPLVRGDNDSYCVLTLAEAPDMPKGRIVLQETFGEIMTKLQPEIL